MDNESRLSPSALGAAGVTRTGQLFRVPRCLPTNRDDARGNRCVFVHDGRDGGVVFVNERNSGSSECVVDVSRESSLVDRRVLSLTHSTCQTCRL